MEPLNDLFASIQKNKEITESGAGGWIGALVAGILVILVVAIYGFIAWSKGKEMAALRHEKAVAEENEHQAKVDSRLAANEALRQAALLRAMEAKKRIDELEKARAALEEDHRDIQERINNITSWDDTTNYLGS